ncbi:protein of unknown function [Bradyrhizobium vignae]|uniref:Uncharacterized protein n=1 Tax=Bradyrhizobium vignae TaxID=1549949 RepID=A0A2U3PTE7_9BRAD|nr:protein of unknown function [Bradyrhizobium vignae]
MFRVTADSLEAYLAFDPNRTADLEKLHALMRRAAVAELQGVHRSECFGRVGAVCGGCRHLQGGQNESHALHARELRSRLRPAEGSSRPTLSEAVL